MIAGRSEQEVAEDIASEIDHILYRKLEQIQGAYQERGYGTEELGKIMYRVTGLTLAAVGRRLRFTLPGKRP